MKKSLIILFIASLLVLPIMASAIVIGDPPTGGIGDLPTLINKILTLVWQFFVGLAVIMIIVAGILFLTAAGNPEKIVQARQAFLWGVVGIAVGVVAFSITTIVRMAVGG